jgi:CubicO group peptidase (beta-lactamase class C family)
MLSNRSNWPSSRSGIIATVTFVLTGVTVVAGPFPAQAQTPASAVADHPDVMEALAVVGTWLEAQRAYERIPGLSAAIVHDQELVWSGAFGMAHPDAGAPATPTTLYSICSISKLFTSVAVMQLRDNGLLDLRDPVSKHLPWYEVEQQFGGSPPVTVEGILTHSSGLPRESDHPYWSAPDFPFPTRAEVIDGLSNQQTLYPARRYFQYSNLGLTLAGELVRELSGMPYDEYVRENILGPLGLDDTHPEMPEDLKGGRLATGYGSLTREGTREPQPFYLARGIAPAAGYASTVEDLARFASWQFRLEGSREEVLHAHTLDEMHRVHYVDPSFDTFWGIGFSVSRRDGKTFVGHGGSCPGYRSQLTLQKDDKVAAVFMANAMVNTGKYTAGMYDLVAAAIRGAATGGPSDDEPAAAQGAEMPDLAPYLGTYSAQPWGSETAIVTWKGGLASLGLPTDTPVRALTRYRHIEGDMFRRIRDDDELGEALVFERDAAGRVTGYRVHGNRSARLR